LNIFIDEIRRYGEIPGKVVTFFDKVLWGGEDTRILMWIKLHYLQSVALHYFITFIIVGTWKGNVLQAA